MELPALRPSSLTPAVEQQLSTWAAAAREALATNTQKAYRVDSRAFADWCEAQQRVSLPATPETVAEFLKAESAAGRAVATIRRRASTISRMHRAAGLPSPCDELVRLALKGIARARGTDQRQASGLTDRDVVAIRARLGDTLREARDLAMIMIGRDLLARSSELVRLTVADIQNEPTGGALVRMRRHKTSTETATYYIGAESVKALEHYLTRAGISTGFVFQSLTKGGKPTGRPLDTRDVRRIVKALAVAGRLEHGSNVSGHSLRVGMAQDLVAADLDLASVMIAGGWRSPSMVARYTERLTASRGAVARYHAKRGAY